MEKTLFQIAAWDYSTGLDIKKAVDDEQEKTLPENRTRTVTTIEVGPTFTLHLYSRWRISGAWHYGLPCKVLVKSRHSEISHFPPVRSPFLLLF